MPVTKTSADRREYRQTKAQARTAVYGMAFGPAKSGIGLSDPLLDHRTAPDYGVLEFNAVTVRFGHYLPLCLFADQRREAVVAKFNSLCPKGAQRFVDRNDRMVAFGDGTYLIVGEPLDVEIQEARNMGDEAAAEIREAFAAEIEVVATPVEAEAPAPKKRGRPKKTLTTSEFGEPVEVVKVIAEAVKKAPSPKKVKPVAEVAL